MFFGFLFLGFFSHFLNTIIPGTGVLIGFEFFRLELFQGAEGFLLRSKNFFVVECLMNFVLNFVLVNFHIYSKSVDDLFEFFTLNFCLFSQLDFVPEIFIAKFNEIKFFYQFLIF